MGNILHLAGDVASELVRSKVPGLQERYFAERLTDSEDRYDARVLATTEFIRVGKIALEATHDGIPIDDPHDVVSTWFATYDRNVEPITEGEKRRNAGMVAATRLVWKNGISPLDLRTRIANIDSPMAEMLRAQPGGSVGEVASLAKRRDLPMKQRASGLFVPGRTEPVTSRGASQIAPIKMFKEVTRFTAEQGEDGGNSPRFLVMALEPGATKLYRTYFGDGFQPLSDEPVIVPGVNAENDGFVMDLHSIYDQHVNTKHGYGLDALTKRAVSMGIRAYLGNLVPHGDQDELDTV